MKTLIFSILLIFIYSCRVSNFTNDTYFSTNNIYGKNIYLVDSIQIINPVFVIYEDKENYFSFITDSSSIKGFSDIRNIYNNDNIYLGSHCFWCHLIKDSLLINKFKNINPEICYNVVELRKEGGFTIFRFEKKVKYFILGLVNINYYNRTENNLDKSVFIKTNLPNSTYYKIVFPVCE
jgi:hypothetical protein